MFIPRYYESLGHLHVGTQPNRAYYVPASTPMDTVGENRVNSDRFMPAERRLGISSIMRASTTWTPRSPTARRRPPGVL